MKKYLLSFIAITTLSSSTIQCSNIINVALVLIGAAFGGLHHYTTRSNQPNPSAEQPKQGPTALEMAIRKPDVRFFHGLVNEQCHDAEKKQISDNVSEDIQKVRNNIVEVEKIINNIKTEPQIAPQTNIESEPSLWQHLTASVKNNVSNTELLEQCWD
jgi:hypothetical protein